MGLGLLLATPLASVHAQPAPGQVAFAKFSPLPVHPGAALAMPTGESLPFGQPLAVEGFGTGDDADAVRLRLEDGRVVWVHRPDLFIPAQEDYVVSGQGYRTQERPRLRLWRGQSTLSEFLTQADLTTAPADFQEVLSERPRGDLRLPVYARDVVDVRGRRGVRVASVMLPIHGDVMTAFDQVRGTSKTRHQLRFLFDVSGDALPFSLATAKQFQSQLRRRLAGSDATYEITVTLFGANLARGYAQTGVAELTDIAARIHGPDRPGKDHREPLLKALHAATAGLDGATQSNLVVVFSGTDRQDEAFIAALGEKASVQNPKLRLPGNTTLLLAQVAPEPGSDLDLLSRAPIAAGAVEALPFDDNLGTVMARRVLKVLRPEEDKPLEDAEIAEVCTLAFKHHTPCILPFEPSTGTPLPRPPLRGQGGDWYATVAWVVVDGLILTDAPSGAPPPSD